MIKNERRLAAIMSADVQGFGRLMGDDEWTTVQTLKRYRGIIAQLIEQNGSLDLVLLRLPKILS